jgi:hypothetical protein
LRTLSNGIQKVIKRFTGADLEATRKFLLRECFIPGKGFSSQYAGQPNVSCTTSAICIYALSETGPLTVTQKRNFERTLLAFRASVPPEQAGAFPRTTAAEPNVWTTSQAALALASLGVTWDRIRPSVEWLLARQSSNGGWNFPGTRDGGYERLIYALYPTLLLLRCGTWAGQAGKIGLSRISDFVESCQEREDPFWVPLRNHLRALLGHPLQHSEGHTSLDDHGRLFESGWPIQRVDEDWMSNRFSMALLCGSNYLVLRGQVAASAPLALLHLRYLADERLGNGWSDKREEHPKTWATALCMLTLHRWARDLRLLRNGLTRLPTRSELVSSLRSRTGPEARMSNEARLLIRRLSHLRPGMEHGIKFQSLILEIFTFLFGEVLKDPRAESRTFLGTLRRDVTFRNAANAGVWCDWKNEHHIHSVLIECKNKEKLSHDDLRQTACYLGKKMGQLGILACRKTTADEVREMLNWFVNNDDKYILIVNDSSLIDWIKLKDRGEGPTDAIADLYRSLREESQ